MSEQEEIKKQKLSGGKFWSTFVAGILWGVAGSFIFGVLFLRNSLINEYQSKLGFKETIAQLGGDIKSAKGWIARSPSCSLPKPADGSKMVAIKLCNGQYASELMNDEVARKTAAMVPCTFAVYQKADGRTYISRLNMKLLGSLLGGKAGVVFSGKIDPDQENILKGLVE